MGARNGESFMFGEKTEKQTNRETDKQNNRKRIN